MRESVVMYVSTYSAILKRISNVEQKEAVFEAIFNYAFYDEPIQEFGDPVADAIMDMVKPLIDSNNKNYVNGCKGGRPKKNGTDEAEPSVKTTGKNHRLKPSAEPSGKGNVNVNENVNENDNDDSHLHSYKDGDAPAPSADAGAAHSPFTFADVKDCAEENDIGLTERQLSNFYSWMEKYNWTINGRKVTKLENALSGYAKKHLKNSQEQEQPAKQEPTKKKAQSKPTIEDEIYEIASYYISQELFDKNPGGHHTLISRFCPKEDFTEEQLVYMADKWCVWPKSGKFMEVDENSDYYHDYC